MVNVFYVLRTKDDVRRMTYEGWMLFINARTKDECPYEGWMPVRRMNVLYKCPYKGWMFFINARTKDETPPQKVCVRVPGVLYPPIFLSRYPLKKFIVFWSYPRQALCFSLVHPLQWLSMLEIPHSEKKYTYKTRARTRTHTRTHTRPRVPIYRKMGT